ncbi:histidine kinase [Crossiella sp. SN42]|uniref:sensor histidine kinase n=1 Tax=Crossiella sp. SN42 TaxID=2944808 RepID=UPI00207C37BC|nr:sensor histidine kinase [Crossiella sp. SN42]MCO1577535.1 histidine kinase [Crossiella sp. SN42]
MSTETRGDRGPDGLRCLRRTLTDLGLLTLAGLDVVVNTAPSTHYTFLLPALACLALLFRREFPRTALVLTIPGLVVGFTVLAAMVALYTVARSRKLDWQTVAGALLVFGGCLTLGPMQVFPDVAPHEALLRALYAALLSGTPVTVGLLVRARCELTGRLTELAAGREKQQRLHDHAVRAEERTRLAREMHDVVSHQVTLIAIQAGALQMVAEDADSKEIAQTIRKLSNRTLEELRNLVGLLRSSTLDCEAVQPTLEDVPQLVADCGLPATLTMGPMPGPVSPQLGCAVYRTVQEALTNIGKHASGAPVTVHLGLASGSLHVEVRNACPRAQDGLAPLPPGGHGLMGLRERAAMLGGTLTAQPTEDGGYVVRASFPLTPENLAAPAPATPIPAAHSAPIPPAPAHYSVTAHSAPANSTPAHSVPARSAAARSVPASSGPADPAPARSVPAHSAPARSVPATTAPARSVPTDPGPARSVPAHAAAARAVPAPATAAHTTAPLPITAKHSASSAPPPAPDPAPPPVPIRRTTHAPAAGPPALTSSEHLAMLRHPRPREPSPAELHLSAQ